MPRHTMIRDDLRGCALTRRGLLGAGAAGMALAAVPAAASTARPPLSLLAYDRFRHYVDRFNAEDPERPLNLIPNSAAWDWMVDNVPAFECPDRELEEIYWFRWWNFRKALVRTPQGISATEFYNRAPVSSAVGHHVMEGRWLRDPAWVDAILQYWLAPGADGSPPMDILKYSGWTIWAAWQRWLVTGDTAALQRHYRDFQAYYAGWEAAKMNPDGSFWQFDVRDAMEESISGSRTDRNLRPPLNSYMYGNAIAMAQIATVLGQGDDASRYAAKAARLKQLVQDRLWDAEARFFKVRFVKPGQPDDGQLADVREQIGFIPWYFDLPDIDAGYEDAWTQLRDPQGFDAPFGITTAERRHPRFRFHVVGRCEWNGPVWPYATSQTLTALGNVLCNRTQPHVDAGDYLHALRTYARSTYRDGKPYIGEYLDEVTGQYLHVDLERGRYYNHSTFCDLVINGLVGLRTQPGDRLVVHPLVPPGTWDWFALDGVAWRGRSLAICWDRDGTRYGHAAGFSVLVDGAVVARSPELGRLEVVIG